MSKLQPRNRNKGVSTTNYVRGTRTATHPKRPVIQFRTLDNHLAKKQIYEFINKNPRSKTSEITERLRINPIQVADMLKELEADELVLSKDIEH